jgi:hypothetical protein
VGWCIDVKSKDRLYESWNGSKWMEKKECSGIACWEGSHCIECKKMCRWICMANKLQWECDGEIPITMCINTFKHIKYIEIYYKCIEIHYRHTEIHNKYTINIQCRHLNKSKNTQMHWKKIQILWCLFKYIYLLKYTIKNTFLYFNIHTYTFQIHYNTFQKPYMLLTYIIIPLLYSNILLYTSYTL